MRPMIWVELFEILVVVVVGGLKTTDSVVESVKVVCPPPCPQVVALQPMTRTEIITANNRCAAVEKLVLFSLIVIIDSSHWH